jgi:hypothetical protein
MGLNGLTMGYMASQGAIWPHKSHTTCCSSSIKILHARSPLPSRLSLPCFLPSFHPFLRLCRPGRIPPPNSTNIEPGGAGHWWRWDFDECFLCQARYSDFANIKRLTLSHQTGTAVPYKMAEPIKVAQSLFTDQKFQRKVGKNGARSRDAHPRGTARVLYYHSPRPSRLPWSLVPHHPHTTRAEGEAQWGRRERERRRQAAREMSKNCCHTRLPTKYTCRNTTEVRTYFVRSSTTDRSSGLRPSLAC